MKEKKELNVKMGERIHEAREAAGMTQEYLVDTISVSVQYISDLERGVVGTSIPTLMKICSSLNVSSDFILFGVQHDNDSSLVQLRLNNGLNNIDKKRQDILLKGINVLLEALSLNKELK